MNIFSRLARFADIFWHLLRTTFQMLYGGWKISKVPMPIITIFGGAHLKLDTPYAEKAYQLGMKFIEKDISILTGGGPGIMEAASCGAKKYTKRKAKIIGIGVTRLGEEPN